MALDSVGTRGCGAVAWGPGACPNRIVAPATRTGTSPFHSLSLQFRSYAFTGGSTGAFSGSSGCSTRTTSIEHCAINALIAPIAASVGTASTPTTPTVNG